ncbi:hypothetical protein [Phaeodactylibacter xiamenensis]|jgi:hypothetical protein|uniref:hypothetical protein n=1 Tax=Phaeodactylibacter xiamenensis TaxID=1524460 RepID=UPI0024A7DC8F|nr:hypothetical protein [Phaeodactylibacter xiamenensis]
MKTPPKSILIVQFEDQSTYRFENGELAEEVEGSPIGNHQSDPEITKGVSAKNCE